MTLFIHDTLPLPPDTLVNDYGRFLEYSIKHFFVFSCKRDLFAILNCKGADCHVFVSWRLNGRLMHVVSL